MTADKQIRVSEDTKDQLKQLGNKGQTYDEIVAELADEVGDLRDRVEDLEYENAKLRESLEEKTVADDFTSN